MRRRQREQVMIALLGAGRGTRRSWTKAARAMASDRPKGSTSEVGRLGRGATGRRKTWQVRREAL